MFWKKKPKPTVDLQSHGELLICLAKRLMEELEDSVPGWRRGYYRFAIEPGKWGSNASVVGASTIDLLDPLQHGAFFKEMNELARRLFNEMGKDGVALVIANADFSYDV